MTHYFTFILFWLLGIWNGFGATAWATEDEAPRRVTQISGVTWSPNGNEIVFATNRQFEEKGRYLWRVGRDGQKLTQLTFPGKDQKGKLIHFTDSNPQWAPNGKWIAFDSDRSETRSDDPKERLKQIFICQPDGKGLKQVSSGQGWFDNEEPAWFPDAQRLAWVTDRNSSADIIVATQNGHEERYLALTTKLAESKPSLSSDGKQMIFIAQDEWARDENTNYQSIYRRGTSAEENPQSAKPHILLKTQETWSVQAVCSPVEPVFVFTKPYPDNNLWLMNLDGTGLREVFNSFNAKISLNETVRPAWSFDGKKIVFVARSRRSLPTDIFEEGLWICDLAKGTALEVLLPTVSDLKDKIKTPSTKPKSKKR